MATIDTDYGEWSIDEARQGKERLLEQADHWQIVWADGTTSEAPSAYFAWFAQNVDPDAVAIEPIRDVS